ncbi:hypothetical protein M011DRAFT_471950 [Sporormia fimetaria CBS 119925]|uniref:Uncharacterized protein n=1 Tax=Sporormia fimetaria CBS 119925 TaxID=1340428 RepID=A0A6A6V0P3_9PLEO|nr:hypothetical protein M011DRAFT_471950 [Sporormia fimetaria CBS 119925]
MPYHPPRQFLPRPINLYTACNHTNSSAMTPNHATEAEFTQLTPHPTLHTHIPSILHEHDNIVFHSSIPPYPSIIHLHHNIQKHKKTHQTYHPIIT